MPVSRPTQFKPVLFKGQLCCWFQSNISEFFLVFALSVFVNTCSCGENTHLSLSLSIYLLNHFTNFPRPLTVLLPDITSPSTTSALCLWSPVVSCQRPLCCSPLSLPSPGRWCHCTCSPACGLPSPHSTPCLLKLPGTSRCFEVEFRAFCAFNTIVRMCVCILFSVEIYPQPAPLALYEASHRVYCRGEEGGHSLFPYGTVTGGWNHWITDDEFYKKGRINIMEVHWKCFPSTLYLMLSLSSSLLLNELLGICGVSICAWPGSRKVWEVQDLCIRPALRCDGLTSSSSLGQRALAHASEQGKIHIVRVYTYGGWCRQRDFFKTIYRIIIRNISPAAENGPSK